MKLRNLLKSTFIAGIFCCVSFSAFAQGAYVKLGGGYNFGLGSDIDYQSTANHTNSGSINPAFSTKFKWMNVKHGKGGTFGGAFGYMFNNNLGFEVGVNYLAGSKNEVKYEEQIGSLGFGNLNSPLQGVSSMSSATETITTKSQMILVQPSLVVATGLSRFNPYTRIGLVLAKGSLTNTYSYSNSHGQTKETEDKHFGGFGFGFQAALGVNFSLNDKIAIYTEGTFNNLTYAPEKGEVTKYTFNGTDLMPGFTTSQKEINFEDEDTYTYNAQDTSSPSTGPKQRYTLNSVGLNAGIKFNF